MLRLSIRFTFSLIVLLMFTSNSQAQLQRVKYNNPGLTVDLGVGLWGWPLPMDYDGDGDIDLLVSCSDVPYNGIYLFENPGPANVKMPVFKPARRIAKGEKNIAISYVDGKPRVLLPAHELTAFATGDTKTRRNIYSKSVLDSRGRVRANQWSYVDYDGDGNQDLVVGHGLWFDYGWDNAFNDKGEWQRGPLRGFVYIMRNTGTNDKPKYSEPMKVTADGKPVDVYGMPSPNFADFDGDGDLDLVCGDFIDGFTWFQNVGTRSKPQYEKGRELLRDGKPLNMPLCMIVVSAIDWDRDGDVDLVVGQEDGRVALLEHTGRVDANNGNMPVFTEPQFFQQVADDIKFGALVTPISFDWDGDGDEDLICGNTAGEVGFIENLGKSSNGIFPKWAPAKLLQANGETIRIQAGENGSIQGPAETKWGYTTISVADWDHDGLPDIVANSIWGKVVWYRNVGTRKQPKLAAAQPIHVQWKSDPPKPAWNWWNPANGELAPQWRTTPVVIDWNGDKLNDLISLDHEGYLAFYERASIGKQTYLLPGKRIFKGGTYDRNQKFVKKEGPLRLNDGEAGKSGRRKLAIVDFDGDGKRDILINSVNTNFMRQVAENTFVDMGPISTHRLAGHTTSPTTVDWNNDGKPELLIGAEDGYFYYVPQDTPLPTGAATVDSKPVTLVAPIKRNDITLEGTNFKLATFKDKGLAYSNRKYVWYDVPKALEGMTFTQLGGGVRSNIVVTVKKATTLHMATSATQTSLDMEGWAPVKDMTFGYTDGGRTRMQVYQRQVKAGERVSIPQGNWTGGILLLSVDAKTNLATPKQSLRDAIEKHNASAANKSANKSKPNVLFIAVDDMRVELGCYGQSHIKSPHIDRLASRGTLFKRAYCQQAVCNPSRASLMTGMRLRTLNIWDLPTHFRQRVPNVITLPQLFKQQGYFTQNIGKIYHNWRQDDYKGDPKSWSVPAVMHYNSHGNDKPIVKGKLPPSLTNVPRCEMRDVPDDAYFDGRIASKAVESLRELKDTRFFLAVGFWKPHAHFNAPKKYWDMYDRAAIKLPANPSPPKGVPAIALHDSREIMRAYKKHPNGKPSESDVKTLRHGYYAAISYVDAQVGKVLAELKRLDLENDTIVVLWSDHGFHLGEHSLWAKTSNFELDARVPLIIATPGQTSSQRTDSLVELLDLYPTLADLCDLPAPKQLEGKSLRPILDDPTKSVKPAAFTWHPRPAYPAPGTNPQAMGYSMRTDRYRYTEWREYKTDKVLARELYDHNNDTGETVNLAKSLAHADTLANLAVQLAVTHPRTIKDPSPPTN